MHSYHDNNINNKNNSVNILFWNPRSICNKKEELCKILEKVDIFACVESWLSEKELNFNIAGFKTYRKDRLNRRGGGILFLVRNKFAFKERCDLLYPKDSTEFAGLTITNCLRQRKKQRSHCTYG